jgi:hypothetical protein
LFVWKGARDIKAIGNEDNQPRPSGQPSTVALERGVSSINNKAIGNTGNTPPGDQGNPGADGSIGPALTKKGTPRKRSPYHTRRDKHTVKLNLRDEWLMAIIAAMGGMRYDQIGAWLAFFAEWREMKAGKQRHMIQGEDGKPVLAPLIPLTENAVRRVIGRWFAKGYAAADKLVESDRIGDEHFWLWMTDAYMAEYGLPFDGSRPPKKMLKHLYRTNEVRLTLARSTKFPRHQWISERIIVAEREEAVPGVPFEHTPDGVLQFEDGTRIGIEVERSSKNYGELGKVLIDLLENYTEVYYFTTEATEAVVETARSLLNTNQQERITIFAVLTD